MVVVRTVRAGVIGLVRQSVAALVHSGVSIRLSVPRIFSGLIGKKRWWYSLTAW